MAPSFSKFFSMRLENELEYICNLEECGKIVKVSKSNRTFNLGVHLSKWHPDKTPKENQQNSANYFEAKKHNLILSCVEMVTVNGRPLAALEDSGFRRIIKPILAELDAAGYKTKIDAEAIKPHIKQMAAKLRAKLKAEMNGRIISLMADVATKNNRGILGINAQYSDNGKIILRTLGMSELRKSHTAETIADTIQENLRLYDISINQIHSFTSDNAKSMLKSGRLLNEAAIEMQNAFNAEFDDDSDVEILSDSDIEIISEDEDMGPMVAAILQRQNAAIQHINGIGCAAHSLQIAIQDALKVSGCKALIRKCREIVKTLKSQNVSFLLKEKKVSSPSLDVKTRWNSSFLMVSAQ